MIIEGDGFRLTLWKHQQVYDAMDGKLSSQLWEEKLPNSTIAVFLGFIVRIRKSNHQSGILGKTGFSSQKTLLSRIDVARMELVYYLCELTHS